MISLSVMKTKIAVVIPNWNGEESLSSCLDSLLSQSYPSEIIVVENGSTDDSIELLESKYPNVTTLLQEKNLGFAGGVNAGIRYALRQKYNAIALFNNDAIADRDWLRHLVGELDLNPEVGIVTCKLLKSDEKHIDSTGDLYTTWGLPYPRGRGEVDSSQYDETNEVFGASGGASLYRSTMLEQIGLFDEDFFAYYEDVDISFRAQLAGWKVRYQPKSEAYHQIGGTSSKISGFTTYQFMKNIPFVYWKNVPFRLAVPMFPKVFIAYWSVFFSSIMKGKITPAIKGTFMAHVLIFKKLLIERPRIQRNKTVSNEYLNSILLHDLPPNADKLRRIRSFFTRSK